MEISQILPYLNNGTKVYVFDSPKFLKGYLEINIGNVEQLVFKEKHKPILRPMANLDKEIFCNGDKFVPINALSEKYNTYYYSTRPNGKIFLAELFSNHFFFKEWSNILNDLYGWHFDVHSLIEKGLAIDVSDFDVAVY